MYVLCTGVVCKKESQARCVPACPYMWRCSCTYKEEKEQMQRTYISAPYNEEKGTRRVICSSLSGDISRRTCTCNEEEEQMYVLCTSVVCEKESQARCVPACPYMWRCSCTFKEEKEQMQRTYISAPYNEEKGTRRVICGSLSGDISRRTCTCNEVEEQTYVLCMG